MKYLKIIRVQKDNVVFDQDELGDRFYIILQGKVGIEIAFEEQVGQTFESKSTTEIVKNYFQALFDNFENVMWSRVPYALKVRSYLQ